MPDVTFFSNESQKDIMTTMDPFLFADALEYKEQLHDTWIDVLQSLKKYPKIFTSESLSKSNFLCLFA